MARTTAESEESFDAVVLALPYSQLYSIEMSGERLRRAVAAHVAHYDMPGHYLRVSVLFDRPFWRRLLAGSWTMLDRFGGCCVYDESAIQEDTSGCARRHFVESRVPRWAGGVSGQPGGFIPLDPSAAHRPEPVEHPRLVVAGDYLFDSTLNGVLRSAQLAADLVLNDRLPVAAPRRGVVSSALRMRWQERSRPRPAAVAG